MRSHLLLLVLFAVLGLSANAATRTWNGSGADNKLSTPANWIQGVAPTSGDDVVFPSFANQYFFLNDLSSVVFNSVSFSGNSYVCTGGGSKTLALTVNAGTHNLGPGLWTLFGPVTVASGASLTVTVDNRTSFFSLDNAGFATIRVKGTYGGHMAKTGSGQVDLDLGDSQGGFAVTVEAGRVRVTDAVSTSLHSGPLLVTGGTFEGNFNYDPDTAIIRGPNAELTGFGMRSARNLELRDGAKLTIRSCFSAFSGNPVVLQNANLNPQFTDCPYGFNPVIDSNPSPLSGAFENYPEGATISAGGRRFKVAQYGQGMIYIRPIIGVLFDLDRDAKADISTFRPSDGTWYSQPASGYRSTQWGLATDKPVPGDYDGDERMDLAVYRPSEGTWYVLRSIDGTVNVVPFGLPNDIPLPRDFDGDGRTDPAVYRPADGTWWANRSSSSIRSAQHGLPGDVPVPADYNGDGMSDVAIFRPSTGLWSLCYAVTCHPASMRTFYFGSPGDKAVSADYDGDGTADLAVYRPSEGNWYQFLSSTQSPNIVNWGIASDQPVPADYDGDGRADVAIFRSSDGNWWINRSTAGAMVQQFGTSEDRPIPGAFVY